VTSPAAARRAAPRADHTCPCGRGVLIAPSILSADFARLADEVQETTGETEWIHVDAMDAQFVPNLTLGPVVVEGLRKHTDAFLDCHLMLERPIELIERFADAGADGCTIHVEAAGGDPAECLARMRELGLHVGLAVNPPTPLDAALPYLDQLDMLLVMSVNPGFGGQAFIPEVLPKLVEAARLIEERSLPVRLQIDGGIDVGTAPLAFQSGAEILVAGSSVFNKPDRAQAIRDLLGAACSH
jgi:ribulose-phosphate 3-epimerase